MARFRVFLYHNPIIVKDIHGNDIKCDDLKQIMIDDNIDFEALKEKICSKLKLTPDLEVAQIAYRCPMGFLLYNFRSFESMMIQM